MKELKISLIVPVYNRFSYVENILKCLIKQTRQPYEVIFADDGSKKDLKELLKKHKKECKFQIKHVFQDDKGFRKSKSCNNAVIESEGNYLIFLDQDAFFPETLIADFIKRIEEKKLSILRVLWSTHKEMEMIQKLVDRNENYGKIVEIISKKERWELKKYLWRDAYRNFRHKIGIKSYGAGLMGIGFALYKEDYIKVNGYDEDFQGWGGEDADLGYRLYAMGMKSVTFTTKPEGIHMCHPLDKTKVGDLNKTLETEKKNKINTKNYRSKFGMDNRKEKDGYILEII